MLALQYKASDKIKHNVTKGNLREEFLKDLLKKVYGNLSIEKGIIVKEKWQSTECDFILLKEGARKGDFKVYDLSDCKMFMEIKSRAKKAEFDALNKTAKNIKNKCSEGQKILVGMFCYGTEAMKRTVLSKFGFKYDKEIDAYINMGEDVYPDIDFVYSLDIPRDCSENVPYFLLRDYTGKMQYYLQSPVIKFFFDLFKM